MKIRRHYFEFDAAAHCSLKCRQCTHLSPYLRPEFADIDTFRTDVMALASVMRVKRFRFVGGEPLLHGDLESLIAIARESRIASKIVVSTNGQLVEHKLTPRMMDLLDSVDVSMYPNTGIDYDGMREFLTERSRKHGFRVNLKFKADFMLVHLERPIEDTKEVQHIFDTCEIAHKMGCHTFKNGIYYKCAKPMYQDAFVRAKGESVPFRFAEADGIPIHEPGLKQRLKDYLKDTTPMQSCRWCLGTNGHRAPHRQLTRQEIKTWDLALQAPAQASPRKTRTSRRKP